MITNEDNQDYSKIKNIGISEQISYENLSSIFKQEEKDKIIGTLTSLAEMRKISDEEIRRDYQLISNIICTFVDFMKIRAPEIDLEPAVIKFYLKLFLEWLENFSLNIFDIPQQFQLKFDYILDRLGKSNLLSLMINIEMEDHIRNVISLLMKIQGDKRYSEKTSNFQNIFLIIKGLLEEVRNITIPMLNDILMNFRKKQNFEKFQLSNLILNEMKNILSAPTNQLLFHMINNDYNLTKDKKHSDVLKLTGDDFILFIKNLSKISNEYLINYLSSVPLNESLTKIKIKNVSHFEILLNIFSNKNSLKIAKDYSQLFSNFLDCFTEKSTKENDKFKIFRSLLKFLYHNIKQDMKKNNLYYSVIEKIKIFMKEVKIESTAINVINTISEKYIKNKKIPIKILRHSQIFLESKNSNLVSHAANMNFIIMKKKIFNTPSLFDLFSEEKRKKFTKLSFLFSNLLNKHGVDISQTFRKDFHKIFLEIFMNYEDRAKISILIFYLSLIDHKANSILHKYLLECLDIFCVFVNDFQAPIKNYSNENMLLSPELNNLNSFFRTSKIPQNIENSKKKLESESNVLKLLDEIKNDETGIKESFMKILESPENKSEILENIFKKKSGFSEDDEIIFRKAFALHFEENEINSIIEWGVLLLNNYDNDNFRGHEYLQCVLSVLFYFIKMKINFLLINKENNDETRLSEIQIEDSYLKIFSDIVEYLKKILNAKTKSKEVINYIIVIIKVLSELKNQKLTDKIKNLILIDLSSFSFENYEISIKALAKLYYELNRSNSEENFLLPPNFEVYLYESDKKLSAVKFINELLKLERKNSKLNEIIFRENYKVFILEDLKHADEDMYKTLLDEVLENPDDNEIKRDMIHLILMKHEILKYEFYSMFYTNSINELNSKNSHETFLKHIFIKIYELCNNLNEIDNFINSKKRSKSDSSNEVPESDPNSLDGSVDQELEEKKKFKIKKILRQLNNINIGKYINLVFKHFDNGIPIKPSHQIKLMNLALYDEVFVRDHLLKKIEKCLKIKKFIHYNLHAIPIIIIFLNDPDATLKKKANSLLAIFINHLLKRLNEYKDLEKYKNKNFLYKFLPEAYLSYLLMYFIFNSNLNLIYQSKETKYFQTVISSFLKILKKITNNKFDSNFLIQNCIKIKNISLKNKKVIKKISSNTYLKSFIKTDNFSVTPENYEHVKNEICNMVIKLINIEFTTGFKYEEFKPQIPIIFLTVKELSLVMSNLKSERGKEDNQSYFNENIELSKIDKGKFDLLTNESFNNVSKHENSNNSLNFGIIQTSITKFVTTSTNQKSNCAVKDYTLRLEPINMSKSKSIVENDFDEFENLPYYNKYKDRNHNDSQISNKEFEAGLELSEEESENKPVVLSSKKMFDEEDNKIKELIEEDLEEEPRKSKRKTKDKKENKGMNTKKRKSKK